MSAQTPGPDQSELDGLSTIVLEGDVQPVPRDRGRFARTNHYKTRLLDDFGAYSDTRRNPEITPEIVEEAIEHGRVESVGEGCHAYVHEIQGAVWRVIVEFMPFGKHSIVTAFTENFHSPDDKPGDL